jgi:hypothetical protein
MPKTKDNTSLTIWWACANVALARVGCREAGFGEARDAYELGESPETFAGYVQFNEDWKYQPCEG